MLLSGQGSDEDDDPLLLRPAKRRRVRVLPDARNPISTSVSTSLPASDEVDFVQTSDAEELDLLAEPSRYDYWYNPVQSNSDGVTGRPDSTHAAMPNSSPSVVQPSSPTVALSPHFYESGLIPASHPSFSRSPFASQSSPSPGSPRHLGSPRRFANEVTSTIYRSVSPEGNSDSPEPGSSVIGRTLRQRKAIQLYPYQLERRKYENALKLRGQKDAIVHRKELGLRSPVDEEGANQDWLSDRWADAEESQPYLPEPSNLQLQSKEVNGRGRKRSNSAQEYLGDPPSPSIRFGGEKDQQRALVSTTALSRHDTPPSSPSSSPLHASRHVESPGVPSVSPSPNHSHAESPSSHSASSTSSSAPLTRKDKKRMRALRRVLPKAAIASLSKATYGAGHKRSHVSGATHTDAESEELRQAKGVGYIRNSTASRRSPLNIVNITSSSDETEGSDNHEVSNKPYAQSRSQYPATIPSDSKALSTKIKKETHYLATGSLASSTFRVREGDLFDRMISKRRKQAFPGPKPDRVKRHISPRATRQGRVGESHKIDLNLSHNEGLLLHNEPEFKSKKDGIGTRSARKRPLGIYIFDGRHPREGTAPGKRSLREKHTRFHYQERDSKTKGGLTKKRTPSRHEFVPHREEDRDTNSKSDTDGDCELLLQALLKHNEAKPSVWRHQNIAPIALDLNVPPLDSTVHKLHSDYLSGTRLVQLLRVHEQIPTEPWVAAYLGIDLRDCRNASMFEQALPNAIRRLVDWSWNNANSDQEKEATELVASLGRHLSWLCLETSENASRLAMTTYQALDFAIEAFPQRRDDWIEDDAAHACRRLWVYWLSVELSYRLWCAMGTSDNTYATRLARYLDQLVQSLLLEGFFSIIDDLNVSDLGRMFHNPCTEIWICIIHLLQSPAMPQPSRNLWSRISKHYAETSHSSPSPLHHSETMWTAIFVLTALSYFTPLGRVGSAPNLPSCWSLVSQAIKAINFDDSRDTERAPWVLRRRDLYIRGLLARCLILQTRWNWHLDTCTDVLNDLCEIFRTRQFGCLHGESADFPAFLDGSKSRGLEDDFDPHNDYAFDLFLKLVIRSVNDLRKSPSPDSSRQIKKILLFILPAGVAQYTPQNPPTNAELSRLYNRYSAVLVSLQLADPCSSSTFDSMISKARQYSNFQKADSASRRANIGAWMRCACAGLAHNLPLHGVIAWLSSIQSTLLLELQHLESTQDDKSNTMVQQLLANIKLSMRSICDVLTFISKMGGTHSERCFPDSSFLQADWLLGLLGSGFVHEYGLAEDIRCLVQTYLSSRLAALPTNVYNPTLMVNGESQEDWGFEQPDMNDLAMLDLIDGRPEDKLAALHLSRLSPALFNLVNKQFPSQDLLESEPLDELDRWVDCWAGCIHVVVQNGLKEWAHYFQGGTESWTKILNPLGRYRVGLRFMAKVLDLDPRTYEDHYARFIEFWLESIVAPVFTSEPLFTNKLLQTDAVRERHPLLQALPRAAGTQNEEFTFDASSLRQTRSSMISKIIENLADYMNKASDLATDVALVNEGKGFMRTMVQQMRYHSSRLVHEGLKLSLYASFCDGVIDALRQHKILEESELSYPVPKMRTI